MNEFDEECLNVFLENQSQLFEEDAGRCRSISGGLHGSCCGKHG